MITNSKQKWSVGQTVNIGFMKGLTVKAALATGEYLVSNAASTKLYSFTPHDGIRAVSIEEARELMAEAEAYAARVAARAISNAQQAAAIGALFA